MTEPLLLPPPRCERCGVVDATVRMWPSMTAYMRPLSEREQAALDRLGVPQDATVRLGTDDEEANRDVSYCGPCGEEHTAYWDDMWAEYRSGLG